MNAWIATLLILSPMIWIFISVLLYTYLEEKKANIAWHYLNGFVTGIVIMVNGIMAHLFFG